MSSTCYTTTCSPDCNPCDTYDNCGCINPTTFECVTKPGVCEDLGITDDMNGKQVIAQICENVGDLQDKEGKVLIDGNDTCPEYLWDKLEEGLNISFTQTGTGCDKKIVINAVEGGTAVDVHVKVSSDDTTSGYLDEKLVTGTYLTKSTNNPAGDEELEIDVVPETLISTDANNLITLGTDGGLHAYFEEADGSETSVVEGTGVTVSGTGTSADPYVISTNASIYAVRSCFDSIWRNVTLVATGNPNVTYVSGTPKYRYRHDGSIEFKGPVTYTVAFGAYSTADRKYTIPLGNIPTTCLTVSEQAGVADLKGINYIDVPQASSDQITQMYGYIIRKSAQNLIVEFQSSFTGATSKTIVVNFDGVISHPSI